MGPWQSPPLVWASPDSANTKNIARIPIASFIRHLQAWLEATLGRDLWKENSRRLEHGLIAPKPSSICVESLTGGLNCKLAVRCGGVRLPVARRKRPDGPQQPTPNCPALRSIRGGSTRGRAAQAGEADQASRPAFPSTLRAIATPRRC